MKIVCGTAFKCPETPRKRLRPQTKKPLFCRGLLSLAMLCESQKWTILDSNPSGCHGGNERFAESGADSGAVGARDTLVEADLDRLIELWPMLVSDDRAALLAHAEHLAALRNGSVRTTPQNRV